MDFPIKNGDFPVRYVSHYQRVKDDEDVSTGKLLPDSGSDDKIDQDLAGLINTLFEEFCPFLS